MADAEVPLPTGNTGATLVIRPQLTVETLQNPAVRRELGQIFLEALEEKERRQRQRTGGGITMQEAADNLDVGRTTLYRGMARIPQDELAKVRMGRRFQSPAFEHLWRKFNR